MLCLLVLHQRRLIVECAVAVEAENHLAAGMGLGRRGLGRRRAGLVPTPTCATPAGACTGPAAYARQPAPPCPSSSFSPWRRACGRAREGRVRAPWALRRSAARVLRALLQRSACSAGSSARGPSRRQECCKCRWQGSRGDPGSSECTRRGEITSLLRPPITFTAGCLSKDTLQMAAAAVGRNRSRHEEPDTVWTAVCKADLSGAR